MNRFALHCIYWACGRWFCHLPAIVLNTKLKICQLQFLTDSSDIHVMLAKCLPSMLYSSVMVVCLWLSLWAKCCRKRAWKEGRRDVGLLLNLLLLLFSGCLISAWWWVVLWRWRYRSRWRRRRRSCSACCHGNNRWRFRKTGYTLVWFWWWVNTKQAAPHVGAVYTWL